MTNEEVKEVSARAEMEYELLKDRVHDQYDEIQQLKKRNKEIYDGFIVAIDEVCETDREKRKYKTKIDKAIEYIKDRFDGEVFTHTFDKCNMRELLAILGDKE